MSDCRLEWDGNTLDISMGINGFQIQYRQERYQNFSASGKIETINKYHRWELTCDLQLTGDQFRAYMAWWSYVRQGQTFGIAREPAFTANTTLDAAAAAGQKVIPIASTSGLTVNDTCLIRAVDNDDEFEWIQITSISAGVSVTAEDNLYYSYTSGDIFRHATYYPSCILLDSQFDPARRTAKNLLYTDTITFIEAL